MRDDEGFDTSSVIASPPEGSGRSAIDRTARHRNLAFAAVYLIWGSTYLGIRVGVETIPPFLLAGSRSFLAGLGLFGWLYWRGERLPTGSEWRRASLAGVVMLAGGNGLVTWAETRTPSNLAALLIAAVPTHVAVMEWLRPGGVQPSRRSLIGVLLGVAGMALLVRPDARAIGDSHWAGVVALLVAGWCWAFASLYTRYQRMHPSSSMSGAQMMIAGGASMLAVSCLRGELTSFDARVVSSRSLSAFVYLTIFGSLVAFSAFNWLVGVTSPARLSTTAYVNPMVAVVLGWVVLGETLPAISLLGAALIIAAVVVMVRKAEPARAR